MQLSRREFLRAVSAAGILGLPGPARAVASGAPRNNPVAHLQLPWTDQLKWANVLDITSAAGRDLAERLGNAQATLAAQGGGVVYFPPGTYRFSDHLFLKDGIVLRGAGPSPVTGAQDEKYSLETRFEFPRYEPLLEGQGTPVHRAFKGIYLENPAGGANCGVVNLAINRGHIHFDEAAEHRCGGNRLVFGCILRNAAVADPAVPDLRLGQKPWQRFTQRHFAAIDVKAAENLLVANNRLPRSGDDNFTMNGFIVAGRNQKPFTVDGVVFDYDNRPGLYVNHFNLGGPGGQGPDGTPETHPFGFRKGIVIRDNYVFNTGRMGIGFAGDGVVCENNVIRFARGVWRPTATGRDLTAGSSTNDNRAIEMRGWRWLVRGNDYEVHRNWAFDHKYLINDGEGLMHEDHANSTIRDSVLCGNRGNTYLSLYKTAGIDGLLIEDNDIRLDADPANPTHRLAIFVSATRTHEAFPCQRVRILNNRVTGGILLCGEPAVDNEIRGNRQLAATRAKLLNQARAALADNSGFDVDETPWQPARK